MRQAAHSTSQSGFTLLELSIVLTIIAILLSSGLSLVGASVERDKAKLTMDEIIIIEETMQKFVLEYGRLPCPALINATRNNVAYGREADCTNPSPPAGMLRVEYPAGSGNFVRIGGLPFYSMHLPDIYIGDAWNSRYLYAVSENLITTANTGSTGHILVQDAYTEMINDRVAWVVVSTGPSAEGGFSSLSGMQVHACDTGNLDGENCDDDGVFKDAPLYDGDNPLFFDDDLMHWEDVPRLFGRQAYVP